MSPSRPPSDPPAPPESPPSDANESQPRPRVAARSGASSKASSRANGSPFLADPGPAFDPRSAETAPEPEPDGADLHVLPGGLDLWDEERVRAILTAQGITVHALVGVAEHDWEYTEKDLEAIAPPLARILNRYDLTRAAAHVGDEVAVTMGLGGYVVRSYVARRAALAARAAQPDRPITGVDADGHHVPQHPQENATWQRST